MGTSHASQILGWGKASVCAVLVLAVDAINLVGSGFNVDLFCIWGTLNHGGEVQCTVLEANAVLILGITDLDSCLEGGFVYLSKKIVHMSARVNSGITIILEVLHLTVDLFMVGNIHLEVFVLVLALVPKGVQLLLKLPGLVLGKAWSKKKSVPTMK